MAFKHAQKIRRQGLVERVRYMEKPASQSTGALLIGIAVSHVRALWRQNRKQSYRLHWKSFCALRGDAPMVDFYLNSEKAHGWHVSLVLYSPQLWIDTL